MANNIYGFKSEEDKNAILEAVNEQWNKLDLQLDEFDNLIRGVRSAGYDGLADELLVIFLRIRTDLSPIYEIVDNIKF